MLCPTCKNVRLSMSERQGVEIDFCPECRGVWLDRGELDKIIERTKSLEARETREVGHSSPPRQASDRYFEDLFNS